MGFYEDFDSVVLSENHGGPTGTIVALCFHDEEAPETNDQAENVAAYFQPWVRQASTTGCIDNNSKVGCVPYGVTAWHSGHGMPWNGAIEGYEHSGYARQTREEWLDEYGIAMLELSAEHFAKRCHDLGIPPRKIDGNQLRKAVNSRDASQGGICGHKDISDATDGGHYDPGPDFPWDYYIDRVTFYYNGGVITPPTNPPTNEDQEIMGAAQEIIDAVNAARDDIKASIPAQDDDRWMGTDDVAKKVYIVTHGVKYHVPGRLADRLDVLEFLGFDNRGVQTLALSVLPEGQFDLDV